ncbi:MAG: carbohydrate ABC transporter permease [Caldilinea sp.]|jgi:multiple sugar transport system permease protein|nr:carbohydrate ABC transporter permease [Caldilinea sp.]
MQTSWLEKKNAPAGHRAAEALLRHSRRWLLLLGLFALSVIMVGPIVWTISTSLRTPAASFSLPPKWLPTDMALENYAEVFARIPFWRQIFNSFFVTLSTVLGQLCTAALAGYAFARLDFPGKTLLFWLVMATLMIPLQATIIPVFVLISRIGLSDSLAALIVPALFTAFGTFLLRQYFMQAPKEFEEVALIDGANQWYIFSRVYLPLAAPGLAVLAVLAFNGTWNEFYRPLVFLITDANFTIPLGLNTLKGYMMTGSISVVLAGVSLSLIPVVLVYLFGQRYLIEGIMVGGLKG